MQDVEGAATVVVARRLRGEGSVATMVVPARRLRDERGVVTAEVQYCGTMAVIQ
jgi:hypothetical protein